VVAHLLEQYWTGDLFTTVLRVLQEVRGAYALGIMAKAEPGKLIAVRKHSPLVIGLGEGENFIASDIPAVLAYTRDVYILEEGELAVLTRDSVSCFDLAGNPVDYTPLRVTWDAVAAERGGYAHFMQRRFTNSRKPYATR